MKKIRINELARELEVKAHEILERLPELGVTEKKTHSSSIDEDVAIKLRQYYGQDVPDYVHDPNAVDEPATEAHEERHEHEEAHEPAAAPKAAVEPETPVAPAPEAAPAAKEERPAPEEPARPMAPIRPPLASGRPIHPPVGATPPPRPEGPRAAPAPPLPPPAPQVPHAPSPAASSPAMPARPEPPAHHPPSQTPPAAVFAPGRPAPPSAKPLPTTTPRPGQVLSGPRQPFPSSPAPGAPQRPQAIPRPPQQVRPESQRPSGPGAPSAPQRPLAGQPAARPVVPPRPDLVAKLSAPRAPVMPQQPAAPRPGVPKAPSAPVPGQPIYRGPIRPGQPMVAKPGVRPGMPPSRPGGPRPQHPTSRGRIEPGMGAPPPPAEPSRGRPGDRRPVRQQRERTEEEKILRPQRRHVEAGPPPISREITISEGITVKELSEKLDVKANLVMKKLMDRGIFVAINQTLDGKLATEVARDFGASTATVSYEVEAMQSVEEAQDTTDLERRAPVVTIMGHVDHGKTSLLDAIREANVAGREAGGITQHIGAYQVEMKGRKIVFIDTPGHEAFTRMRSRGAKVTDIVILVVAADDGVMPQTLEAIDHAKAAAVPIIVAINKIDKADAQPERIKQQLSDRGLLPEDWGGDVVMVPVSARTQQGLPDLLEMILLVADMQDLKANPSRPAMGTVIEAQLDRGRGPVATVLVRNGTLSVGDFFICGAVFGKVRAMLNDRGTQIRKAEPSTPVEVLGLDSLPEAGDDFQVVTDTAKAKQIVNFRDQRQKEAALAKSSRITLEQLHQQMREGEVKELPVIIKADVGGSAEVLKETLEKLSNDKVKVRVIHSGVGAINESDILLASASNAIVIGFNVRPERNAAATAEQEKVDVRLHTIIYNLTDEIKRAMSGLLAPVFKEVYRGKAEVRETFRISKVGAVAGCQVIDGSIPRDSECRVLRDNIVVHTGKIGSLRRFKDDVSEVKIGMECGITLANFADLKQGDIIEAFATERVATEVFA
uniref:Translation initiation factor IF-2 n=1 Tax=Solibacter usitatus (strain Ellin6076) TaxID=234267 RepID=IF2_SOLUE|nr:RecName: Full=Translation initiation factor IF-2 [Candidatus Solibacter usitatus Ellin6076]